MQHGNFNNPPPGGVNKGLLAKQALRQLVDEEAETAKLEATIEAVPDSLQPATKPKSELN